MVACHDIRLLVARTLDDLTTLQMPGAGYPRGRRHREGAAREGAVVKAVNESVNALNFMGWHQVGAVGAGIHPPVSLARAPSAVQRIHQHISEVDFELCGEKASLKAVLRGQGGDYASDDLTQCALTSFSIHSLSVPSSTVSAPLVYDLPVGDPEAQQTVKEPQRLLRSEEEVIAMVAELGDITPYVDPILLSSRRRYMSFCRRMFKAGLCRPTRCYKDYV